MEVCTICCFI